MDTDNKINFDVLVQLAKEDPEKFEQYRQQQIANAITESSPEHQTQLRALQWNLDQQLKQCRSSYSRIQLCRQLLHEKIVLLNDALNHGVPQSTSTLIPFPSDSSYPEK
ncbi:MAG: DUF3135 domain-containing protein [Ferrimonas sp.]